MQTTKVQLKVQPTKILFHDMVSNYKILACHVLEGQPPQTNRFGDITISGTDLEMLRLNEEVEILVDLDVGNKYEGSYTVAGMTGIEQQEGRFIVKPPHDFEMLKLLMSSAQAQHIYTAYPNFIELVLNNEIEKIDYKKIYNVGAVYLEKYINKIQANFKTFTYMAQASELGITNFEDVKILSNIFSSPEQMTKAIQENPYQSFINLLHYEFPKADHIIHQYLQPYIRVGERGIFCVDYLLRQVENEGDTCLDAYELKAIIQEEYPTITPILKEVVTNDNYFVYIPSKKVVASKATYKAEENIAHNIMQRVQNPIDDHLPWDKYKTIDGLNCTTNQAQILQIASEKSVGMLIGSAGTGKTTSVKALVKMLDDMGKEYKLLAPTGIAAKRLHQATNRPTQTIAMYLLKSAERVNDLDYIIIDEMSMVGVHTFSAVLDTVLPETKIIMICDNAQLASISCGNIVQDILDVDCIPTAHLDKVFRYGVGGIDTIATDTRNGVITNLSTEFNDYKRINQTTSLIEQLKTLYGELLNQGYSANDILILTPFNKRTYGALNINNEIQNAYNPNTATNATIKLNTKQVNFRLNDKVVNIKNNYHATALDLNEVGEYEDLGRECAIFNGDIGTIRAINENTNEGILVDVQFDEELVRLNGHQLNQLRLGYAMTVHKVQGSQSKVVIFIATKEHAPLISRNLLYVARSRSSEMLYEIGDEKTVNAGLDVEENQERNTLLKELIRNDL